MGRSFLLSPQLVEQSVLTASGAVGASVVTNLQKTDPRDVWRASGSAAHVVVDTTAVTMNRSVNTIGLGFFNSGGIPWDFGFISMRVRHASTLGLLTSAPDFDTTYPMQLSNANGYRRVHWWLKLPSTMAPLYWRLDFTVTGGTYVEFSRLLMGVRIQPARPVSGGWSGGGSEPLAATRSMFGSQKRRPMGGVSRATSVLWQHLTMTELAQITQMLEQRGSAGDFMLVKDEDETSHLMLVTHLIGVSGELQYQNTFSKNFSYQLSGEEFAPLEMY